MHVTKYFLVTRKVLGSDMYLSKKGVVKTTLFSRYYSKQHQLRKDKSKDVIMDLSQFIVKDAKPLSGATEDFISLGDLKQPNDTHNPLGIYDKSTEMYIQGKMIEQPQQQPVENPYIEILKQRMAQYNKHLHEHPSDVDMWLEFVNFQSDAIMLQPQPDAERQRYVDR